MYIRSILLLASLLASSFSLMAQLWPLQQKTGASTQDPLDNLGISVAISDSVMIAGAWQNDGFLLDSSSAVNGSGAAYVYHRQANGMWMEVQKLISSNQETSGQFGFAVAIDRDYAIIGAKQEDVDGIGNAGACYVYRRSSSGEWTEESRLTSAIPHTGDGFGSSVAISGDYALIGAPEHDFDVLNQDSVARAGAAYLFQRQASGEWLPINKFVSPDREAEEVFGKYLDIDKGGIVIGAPDATGAYFASKAGAAYALYCGESFQLCDFSSAVSSDFQELTLPNQSPLDWFGWDVAISNEWAVVGKSGDNSFPAGATENASGSAHFFQWDNGSWIERQQVYPSHFANSGQFGRAIDIDGTVCVIGDGGSSTDGQDQDTIFSAGSAYVFELQNDGTWQEVDKLLGTQRDVFDLFGEAVGLSENQIVIGAWKADSIGNAELNDAGALYTFERAIPLASTAPLRPSPIQLLSNPSSDGWLRLQHTGVSISQFDLKVLSIQGQTVFSQHIYMDQIWQKNFSMLPSGIYLVQIITKDSHSFTQKWIRE